MHMSENQPASARPRPVLRGAVVDHAIDRAVRQMVQIDPRPGLGRRVLSRIAMPAARRSLYSTPYMAVAGALAMLVLAVGLLRPDTARNLALPGTAGDQASPVAAGEYPSNKPTGKPESSTADRLWSRLRPARPAEPLADGPADSAPSGAAGSRAANKVASAPRESGTHAEAIPMPEIVNLFGGARNLVSGAHVTGLADATATPPAKSAGSSLEIAELPMTPLTIEPLRITPIRTR